MLRIALHQQGLDTTTPAGKAMFQMMGVFAEFERSMIVERVRAGLARAKVGGTRSGKAFGRPRTSPEVEQRIRDALATPGRPWLSQDRRSIRRGNWHGSTDRARVRMARRDPGRYRPELRCGRHHDWPAAVDLPPSPRRLQRYMILKPRHRSTAVAHKVG